MGQKYSYTKILPTAPTTVPSIFPVAAPFAVESVPPENFKNSPEKHYGIDNLGFVCDECKGKTKHLQSGSMECECLHEDHPCQSCSVCRVGNPFYTCCSCPNAPNQKTPVKCKCCKCCKTCRCNIGTLSLEDNRSTDSHIDDVQHKQLNVVN